MTVSRILLFLTLVSTNIFATDKILWAPSGDWKILTATSQKVNLNDTLYATQGGKVGIGVLTPSLKLEVNGTVKATAAQIDTISNTAGTDAVTFSQGLTVTSGKVLKADFIQTSAGGSPPGFIPIGGMIAVMPTTHANVWQPPLTGVIKDGFMRADGGTVPTCADCIIPAGTTLPNMVGSFPKGTATTTGTATASQKLVAANIPQVSTSYTPAGTIDVTLSGVTPSLSSNSVASTTHNHEWLTTAGLTIINGSWLSASSTRAVQGTSPNPFYLQAIPPINQYTSTPTPFYSAGTETTTVAISGGSYSVNTKTFAGTAATITVGTAVGAQTTAPDPANVTVVWVIRVK